MPALKLGSLFWCSELKTRFKLCVRFRRELWANCWPALEWRHGFTEIGVCSLRALRIKSWHSSIEAGFKISWTKAELSFECTSLTASRATELAGTVSGAGWGNTLLRLGTSRQAVSNMPPAASEAVLR